MVTQKEIWEEEHASGSDLPTETSKEFSKPSSGVVEFFDWLKKEGIQPPQKVIDIGCGKGRNSLYAASKGYTVTAMDYIQSALDVVAQRAEESKQQDHIHIIQHAMNTPWPFEEDTFDIAIDSFASIDVETLEGRTTCINEMYRTLKPGGYALVMVVSAHDELEAQMIKDRPASEPNSCFWPSGKFQKNYTKEEFRTTYAQFDILELQEKKKQAHKRSRDYTATNYWMIVQKP